MRKSSGQARVRTPRRLDQWRRGYAPTLRRWHRQRIPAPCPSTDSTEEQTGQLDARARVSLVLQKKAGYCAFAGVGCNLRYLRARGPDWPNSFPPRPLNHRNTKRSPSPAYAISERSLKELLPLAVDESIECADPCTDRSATQKVPAEKAESTCCRSQPDIPPAAPGLEEGISSGTSLLARLLLDGLDLASLGGQELVDLRHKSFSRWKIREGH